MNFTIASYHLLTCLAKATDKHHLSSISPPLSSLMNSSEMTVLVLVIDTDGVLHVMNPQAEGEEMVSLSLLSFHGDSGILVSDVEGDSEDGPILVTGAKDGSLHVLGIQVRNFSALSSSVTLFR